MNTTRYELPSGGWVELRDPNFLRGKDRQALMRKITSGVKVEGGQIDGDAAAVGLSAFDQVAALVIAQWYLPYAPEPITNPDGTTSERGWTLPAEDVSILGELLAPDYHKVLTLSEPAWRVLMPSKPSPDQHEDPESPSGPESA